jgi:hypothetical protein
MGSNRESGHVFLSYVHEDSEIVGEIRDHLEAAGIPVWMDKEQLWGGSSWKDEIRQAITNNALAFVACFSPNSVSKDKTYQWQEINFAIEELNQRNPMNPWFIPVCLSQCEMPNPSIGGARTLSDLQRIDLSDGGQSLQLAKLIGAVERILHGREFKRTVLPLVQEADLVGQMKTMIIDGSMRIALDDLIMNSASALADEFSDVEKHPVTLPSRSMSAKEITREILRASYGYVDATNDLSTMLVTGCTWGDDAQDDLWRRAIVRAVGDVALVSGNTGLLDARAIPLQVLLYSSGIAALNRSRYNTLKTILIDAKVRLNGVIGPMVGLINPGYKFEGYELVPQLLAYGADPGTLADDLFNALATRRIGWRYTPQSEWLENVIREYFREIVCSDDEFHELFDRFEFLASALIMDGVTSETISSALHNRPIFGTFLWRRRSNPMITQMFKDVEVEGSNWPPLRAGLFGSSVDRALVAITSVHRETAAAALNMH